MKNTNKKQLERELLKIYNDVFDNDEDRLQAVDESFQAHQILRQDALYNRSMNNKRKCEDEGE